MIDKNLWTFIEAYVVAQFFIISLVAKVLDAKQVIEWLNQNLAKGRIFAAQIFYAFILVSELAACVIVVLFGAENGSIPAILMALALGLTFATKIAFRGSEGCPCFGLASLNSGLDARHISIALALLVGGLYTASFLFGHIASDALALTLISIFGTSIFYMSATAQKKILYGSRHGLHNPDQTLADDYEITHPAALIFLSAHCPTCMAFLKYIEEFSKLYAKHVHLYISIHGYGLSDRAKYGETTLLAHSDEHLAQKYDVKNVPTLVLLQADGQVMKFRGIDACGLALTRIAYADAFRQLSGRFVTK